MFRVPLIAGYCFGTTCPCGNEDPEAGCLNSFGHGGRLSTKTIADCPVGVTSGALSADGELDVSLAVPPVPGGFTLSFTAFTHGASGSADIDDVTIQIL